MKVAVVTGASAGLGREFVKKLAIDGKIDEIWMIARRAERLQEYKILYPNVNFFVLPIDLSDKSGILALEKTLEERKPVIKILINNAGFGRLGDVFEEDYQTQLGMVEVNDAALTAVTALVIPYMPKNSGAQIINVCSIASFSPTPHMTVYSATKAYVYAFSRGLREELRVKKSGINVLAVCPGPMRTEFLDIAKVLGRSKTIENIPFCDACKVANRAVEKSEKGRAVYTPLFIYKLYRIACKFIPKSWMMKISKG